MHEEEGSNEGRTEWTRYVLCGNSAVVLLIYFFLARLIATSALSRNDVSCDVVLTVPASSARVADLAEKVSIPRGGYGQEPCMHSVSLLCGRSVRSFQFAQLEALPYLRQI